MNSVLKRILAALAGTVVIAAAIVGALFAAGSFEQNNPVVAESASGGTAVTYPSPAKTIAAINSDGIALTSRTSGKYFYTLQNGVWTCTYLKGVDMGLTLPTTDLANPDIPYATYMTWFKQITAMNANTVRVYTIMNPDFYAAFADYNAAHADSPLWLLQGVWFSEDDMNTIGDAFGENKKIVDSFMRAVREATDIIHGKCDYTSYGSIKKAVYDRDISKYVAGFILGLEWQPDFVIGTNKNNTGMAQYAGSYLTTKNAAPFEIFLAEVGDTLIKYETDTYHEQQPIAFLNWSTTDTLSHTNEPFTEEDEVSVNTETIRAAANYFPGLFAAVDVYPYYPEFINHQPDYLAFKDESGHSDPYRAYLRDLQGQYSVPVIVAEFGVSTSRGVAHTSAMGFDQGGVTETQQGQMVVKMAEDIALESYAGSMIFSWQDEWFKQTWNTVKYAPEDASRRGLNVESAEQRYGICACDPRTEQSACYPDGDASEWTGTDPVYTDGGVSVSAKTDEGYLYLLLNLPKDFSFDKDKLAVALSLTGHGSSSASAYSLSFSKPADFLLILNGKSNTRLLTDAYYDRFYYQYSVLRSVFSRDSAGEKQNSGLFRTIRSFLSNEMTLPLTGKTIAPQAYESGLLRFGNANPASASYDSLADFYSADGQAEIRIPWYLLNVMNGPEKTILGDFYKEGKFTFTAGDKISLAAARLTGSKQSLTLADYSWPSIAQSTWHMRLKQSYAIIQSGYGKIMSGYK